MSEDGNVHADTFFLQADTLPSGEARFLSEDGNFHADIFFLPPDTLPSGEARFLSEDGNFLHYIGSLICSIIAVIDLFFR
ncbi:MAG: hypothetical protein CVV23_11145 [Ignavibacteriae bacterium HGW-Ignavibacteriae-2]|nr:MAG: hypothetical protein CVV23_11145 [Ignavibacteriae bacterium HGW-Ignavibacteriae-2]